MSQERALVEAILEACPANNGRKSAREIAGIVLAVSAVQDALAKVRGYRTRPRKVRIRSYEPFIYRWVCPVCHVSHGTEAKADACHAQAIEAGTAMTAGHGPKDESASLQGASKEI